MEKTSRFSNDGTLMPRSIRLRKSTEISRSSANCSWFILRAERIPLRRLPNFSRRVSKVCTEDPNVAHVAVTHHRMRLRVRRRDIGHSLSGCSAIFSRNECEVRLSPLAGLQNVSLLNLNRLHVQRSVRTGHPINTLLIRMPKYRH